MKYTATIVEDRQGVIHVRISSQGPQTGGAVRIIKILHGDDYESLKRRAVLTAAGKPLPDWSDGQLSLDLSGSQEEQSAPGGFHTAFFYLTKDGQAIKIRYEDRPAGDEDKVVDVLNGPDLNELRKRARRYLLLLKRRYGIVDGPRLP